MEIANKKIIITGSNSFIGKNLIAELYNRKCANLSLIDSFEALDYNFDDVDTVFHLLTEYRSLDSNMFQKVNIEFTQYLLTRLNASKSKVVMISSEQAGNGTPYGESKLQAELMIEKWGKETGNQYSIIRLANEFGKWCPPNFNSVIATFCHKIAYGEEITVNKHDAPLRLMYVDDIIRTIIEAADNNEAIGEIEVEPVYCTSVGVVADIIKSFPSDRSAGNISEIDNDVIRKLYSTYLSYLPQRSFGEYMTMHGDARGSFTELLHFNGKGQVSVNITKPGVTKGNHWHHTKTEKFIVVAGQASIKFRQVGTDEVIEYIVSGDKIESIDIPPGYTHNITNIGDVDLITIMWANEIFDPKRPDTFYMNV